LLGFRNVRNRYTATMMFIPLFILAIAIVILGLLQSRLTKLEKASRLDMLEL